MSFVTSGLTCRKNFDGDVLRYVRRDSLSALVRICLPARDDAGTVFQTIMNVRQCAPRATVAQRNLFVMVTEEGNAHRRVSLRSECIPIEALGHGRLRCDQSGRRAALAHAKIVIQGCLFAHERHGQTRPRRDNNPRRFARRAINCSADKGQRGSVMVCCWLTLGDERAAHVYRRQHLLSAPIAVESRPAQFDVRELARREVAKQIRSRAREG